MLTVSFSSNLASIKTTEALLRPIESMLQFEWLKNIALKHYLALLWRCDDDVVDDKYCDVLIPTLRFAYEGTGFLGRLNIDKQLRSKAEDISYLNRRRLIPTHELPSLRIYMTDGAKIKLQNKRKTTLSERYAMLLTNDDDWVDATIFSENGALSNKTKVKLRLKGDLADHFGDPKKVSMRVEAKGNGLVFGTTKFSIQSPKTGYDQLEAIVSDTLRRVGVIAPDYFFVDVRLNDQVVGVMAFVEHFTKEMLESQGRREGPIVMIDEEWVWEQRFLNHNRMSDGLWQSISENLNWRGGQLWQSTNIRNIPPLALRDYPVQIFKLGVFDPRLVRINNSIRGASLLRDMVDGRISGRLVFDYDLMSLWWIMSHIWGAIHNLHFTNERFYFNPITNLLEPIVFNANAQPRQWCEPRNNPKTSCIVSDFSIRSIWTDPLFQRAVVRNKKRIAELLESTEFRDWLVAKQNEYLSLLDLDERGRSEPPIDTQLISGDILASNLLKFDEEVSRLFKQLNSKDPKNLQSSSAIQKESDLIKNEHQELLKVLEPLANHIRPFLYWSLDGFDLEIKNLTLSDVTIDSLFSARYSRKNYLQESIQIPSYQQESVSHILRLPITIPDPREATELRIRYSYRGQQFTKPVFLQFKNHNFGYKKLEDIKDWLIDIGVMIDETKRTITFPPGHYILTDRLQLTEDWRVRISAGATVEFRRGGALKVNGPVHAIGHKDNPVRIIIDSDPQLGVYIAIYPCVWLGWCRTPLSSGFVRTHRMCDVLQD